MIFTLLAVLTQVSFELPDVDGKMVRRSDFTSKYLLIVSQGVP